MHLPDRFLEVPLRFFLTISFFGLYFCFYLSLFVAFVARHLFKIAMDVKCSFLLSGKLLMLRGMEGNTS
jgi:hypothetical protein